MRFVAALVMVAVLLLGGETRSAFAADSHPEEAGAMAKSIGEGTADGGDDDTVNVQLVVFGIVGGVVFLLLPLAYLLRRRMGLTAYTPPTDGH